jgi:hypothetical protein
MITERHVRYQAALLAKGRFVGRAVLEHSARSCDLALAKLRLRLGFAGAEEEIAGAEEAIVQDKLQHHGEKGQKLAVMPRRERLVWAHKHYGSESALMDIVAGPELAARDKKHANRVSARKGDVLASRKPRHAERVIVKRRAKQLVTSAMFSTATHGHTLTFEIVEPGAERAVSSTEKVRPSAVGLPNAYARKAFWVTLSQHDFEMSAEILSASVKVLNDAAPCGILYLRADLRVRQGRGTALVMERLGPKGGWAS